MLEDIKKRIQTAQHKAVLGANVEMLTLYWNIGKIIIENSKYGAKFVDNLSQDICSDFPDSKGYSVRNLRYMRKFAETYPNFEIMQRSVALLPWRNNIVLMDKIKDEQVRNWYIKQNIANGWTSNVLWHILGIGREKNDYR